MRDSHLPSSLKFETSTCFVELSGGLADAVVHRIQEVKFAGWRYSWSVNLGVTLSVGHR